MVSKWLHLEYLTGDPWILPIYSAINDAIVQGKTKALSTTTKELGLSLSIRLDMLPYVVKRINEEVQLLYQECQPHSTEHVFSSERQGCAFRINNVLKYRVLADVDSLLFEINSCCELMRKFFMALYNHAGKTLIDKEIGPLIRDIIKKAGQDPSWFTKLITHRNFLIHEGAPYIAIDITNEPNGYDIIVMKENIINFTDESKFFSLLQLNEIVQGFLRSKSIIQADLISLFKQK